MPGIAVRALDFAGGAQLAGGQDWFFVEDELAVVLGDHVVPHPPWVPLHVPDPFMIEGSDWMTIDAIPVCRRGHLANCGHPTTGRDWFLIDE